MIQIRVGDSWRHDPDLRTALRRAGTPARAAAVARIVDVLAIEVDGVDLGAGRLEGPLLPSLEALLRAIARVLAGAPHASVPLGDGEVELVLRRRAGSALLTLVRLDRPARVLVEDVEVDVEALAAAALDATADLARSLAEAEPAAAALPGPRKLEAAARALRATEPAPPRGPEAPARARPARPRAVGAVVCEVELHDEEGLLAAYAGGRPDLGSLLAPGRVVLRARGGAELASADGAPFLLLRELAASAHALAAAVRRGDREAAIAIPQRGRGGAQVLRLDLAAGTLLAPGGAPVACPPLDLAAALLGGAAELVRVARARNPLQGENGYLAELEAAAADGLAQLAELAAGEKVARAAAPARARVQATPPQRPLGPGRLRRVAFRRTAEAEVGAPAGEGLFRAGALLLACGRLATLALPAAGGPPAWRGAGAAFAVRLGDGLLLARDGIDWISARTGHRRWTRPGPRAPLTGAVALVRGPLVLVEGATALGVDPGTGRTLWRFAPPGARRLHAAAFGSVAVIASDAGLLYGLDAAGGVAFRLRLPGPALFAPTAAGRSALVACATGPGATLVAIDPATGRRAFEAPLDFTPASPPLVAGRRLAVSGTVGGDPVLAVLDARGAGAWTVAPPLSGALAVGAGAAGLLVARDDRGALLALGRDGAPRWATAAPAGHPPPGRLAPRVVRSAVVAAHEGLAVHDAATGALLGVAPHLAPVRLLVGADLSVAAMDPEGVVTALRLATHLSVV